MLKLACALLRIVAIIVMTLVNFSITSLAYAGVTISCNEELKFMLCEP